MNLRRIMLNKKNQSQKATHYDSIFITFFEMTKLYKKKE